jgi:hypothetical protein
LKWEGKEMIKKKGEEKKKKGEEKEERRKERIKREKEEGIPLAFRLVNLVRSEIFVED